MTRYTHYQAETFTGPDCVGYLISRAQAYNRSQLEAVFAGDAISFTQWRVLICLRDGLANTCADISRELAHDKGSMTRIVDQLEARGLLTRRRDGEDRRVVFLELTPAGRDAVNGLVAKVVDYYNEVLAEFTPQEVALFTGLLAKFKTALQAKDGERTVDNGALTP